MTPILLLMGLGLLLIVAEVFVPSMGMLGLAASLCIIGAVAWAFSVSTELGVQMLIAAAVLVPVLVTIAFKVLPYSPLAKRLMARGFTFEDGRAVDRRDAGLLGVEGVAESVLRPAGVARLAGRRVDVLSRGELVEAGARVRVIEVEGNRVVVALVEPAEASASTSTVPPNRPTRGEA